MTENRPTLDIARELRAVAEPGGFLGELLSEAAGRLEHLDAGIAYREGERDGAFQAASELTTHLSAALPVLAYVSRGRGFVDVEPYPDATARRVLGAIDDAGRIVASAPQPERRRSA